MQNSGKQKQKPLLLSILFTYWVALIPLILVIVFSAITYIQHIESQNLQAQSAATLNAAKAADSQLKSASTSAMTLLINNDNVRALRENDSLSESETIFQLWKSQKDLFMQRNSSDLLSGIFLSFPGLDTVLTTEGVYAAGSFGKSCENLTGISYQTWTSLASANGSLRYYIVDGVSDTAFIIFQRYFPIATRSNNTIAYSLVDRAKLLQLLRATSFYDQTAYAIVDSQGHVFGDAALSASQVQHIAESRAAGQYQEDDWVIDVAPLSVSSSMCLVSVVPHAALYAGSRSSMVTIIVILLAAGLLATLFLTYYYAKRQAKPVEQIQQLVSSRTPAGPDAASGSAFQQIASGIHTMLQQLETSNGQIKSQQEALRSHRLLKILRDRDDTEEHIRTMSHTLGITWEAGRLTVACVELDKLPDKLPYQENEGENHAMDTILTQVVLTAMATVLSPEIACRAATDDTRVACVLSGIPEYMSSEDLQQRLQPVLTYLREQLTADAMIAIGHIDANLTGLQSSYREARTTLDYMRMSMPDRRVMSYDEMECLPNAEMPVERSFQIQRVFLNQMQVEDYENARQTLLRLLDENSTAQISPVQMMSLESTLSYALSTDERAFADSSFVANYTAMVVRLRAAQTRDEADGILQDIFRALEDTRTEAIAPGAAIINSVIDYTQKNYKSPDISIGAIADHFHVSISYISRQFKRSQGIGLLEYIHMLRIDEAKRLLKDTDDSIKDIAMTVGFINSLTLSRSFKRYEGILPSEYRKISRQEK